MKKSIDELILNNLKNPLGLLNDLDGLYECPKDDQGKRIGQLVGYAANYKAGDGIEKQFVGDIYANFAKVEQHPNAMAWYAKMLLKKIPIRDYALTGSVVFVGPQMGGISIAQLLALYACTDEYDVRYACAEKKIIQLKTKKMREQSEIVFARHTLNPFDRVFIAEDVLNNFSTTDKTMAAIESYGAVVHGIVGILNRSSEHRDSYVYGARDIPVISLVWKDYPEYKQDDPAVIEDVEKENLILKPKDEWKKLIRK